MNYKERSVGNGGTGSVNGGTVWYLGNYKLVLLDTWEYRVGVGLLYLYILKKWRFGRVLGNLLKTF